MQDYNSLIEKIARLANLTKEEIERRVEAKKAKLSGLISKEGAAQIVAAELNVSFENEALKISELASGMKKVNISGKIINLFPVREFNKNNKQGKVANLIIADETGNIKVVLWDTNHISLIETTYLSIGDSVEIKNAAMRESEVHLSGFSELKKSEAIFDNVKTERSTTEKSLAEIAEGQSIKTRALVVQFYPPRFFNVCPECNKKLLQTEEGFICKEHNKVLPKERALLNLVIDDGTETIRVVLFSDQLAKLTSQEDLKNPEKLNEFRDKLLGTEYYISGIIRRNSLFNNLELIASDIEQVNPDLLIEKLEKAN
jgi:ssDNA-binding replication factor A large subunit